MTKISIAPRSNSPMKMIEFLGLEKWVSGHRFLNGFAVKMVHRGFAPWNRLNNMMCAILILDGCGKSCLSGHLISKKKYRKRKIDMFKLVRFP